MKEKNQSNLSNSENQGRGASMGRIEDGVAATSDEISEPKIDDRGTDQYVAARVMKRIRDEVFELQRRKACPGAGAIKRGDR